MKHVSFNPKHYDLHKSLFSGKYSTFPQTSNKTIAITVDGHPYKIDLMTALFFHNEKAILLWLSYNHFPSYKPGPFIDCALSMKSGHPKFSLFSLCETPDDVGKLLLFFRKVGFTSYSKFSIEFIQKNLSLRGTSIILNDFLPCPPLSVGRLEPCDVLKLADTFFFNEHAPSDAILHFISEANQIALSLGAHFSTNNTPKSNKGFLLSPQAIIDRLGENPELVSDLPPIYKLLLLSLEAKSLEPMLSESDIEILCQVFYSTYRSDLETMQADLERMREVLIKKLVALYPELFFKHLPSGKGIEFWKDVKGIEVTSAYKNAQTIYFIIKIMEIGEDVPDDVIESVPSELLKQALDEDFMKRSPKKNARIFSKVLEFFHQDLLSQEFIQGLNSLNDTDCIAYFFQRCSSSPLYAYLSNRPAFIPYLFKLLANSKPSRPLDLPEMDMAQSRRILKSPYFARADRVIKKRLLCEFGHLLRTEQLLVICQHLLPVSFELLDEMISYHQDNTEEYSRTYGRPFKVLLETDETFANAYYLSGLRDINYAYRVEWLHHAGFKINVNQIENALEETKISSQERLELKQVLLDVSGKRSFKKFRDVDSCPLNDPLKSTLIALFDRYHSNLTRKLPELSDLVPFELCAMALFYRLNIAKSHQNVILFCDHIRTQKELPASMTDLDVLKHELSDLIETSSNERITLNWLTKADPEMCETLFKLYAWQSYDPRYAFTASTQLHDMIEQGMNASSIERDAAAASLFNHQQLTCLNKKVEGLEQQLATLQTSMQRQTELLLQLVNPSRHQDAQPSHHLSFF